MVLSWSLAWSRRNRGFVGGGGFGWVVLCEGGVVGGGGGFFWGGGGGWGGVVLCKRQYAQGNKNRNESTRSKKDAKGLEGGSIWITLERKGGTDGGKRGRRRPGITTHSNRLRPKRFR